jgi:hypothetical protein
MKRILLLVAGVAGGLIALGFILPAVAWWRQSGFDGVRVALPLLLGVGLVLGATVALAKGATRSQA